MLPAHVRDLERAAIRITSWLDRLGATAIAPDSPVTAQLEASGILAGISVDADVHFADGRFLHVVVQLDAQLQARRYTFDLVVDDERKWGSRHQEPAGFHQCRLPPLFAASLAEPATFEKSKNCFTSKWPEAVAAKQQSSGFDRRGSFRFPGTRKLLGSHLQPKGCERSDLNAPTQRRLVR